METGVALLSSNPCGWNGLRRSNGGASGLVSVRRIPGGGKASLEVERGLLRLRGGGFGGRRDVVVRKVSCSYKKKPRVELDGSCISIDEDLILKKKAASVAHHLNGQCVHLVGMMGSGKSTVGKILSEALEYTFFDSDTLVEKAVGAASVAQIFKEHGEAFFRDNESKVLQDLSLMKRLVIATGGGAVIRSINWTYMKHGVTVWLDVPLEALARRIAAVGTASRPLLHHETGDAYTKALVRLRELSEERGEAYTNADTKVSLESIAAKDGKGDVNALTATAIAMEALERIEDFLVSGQLEASKSSRYGG